LALVYPSFKVYTTNFAMTDIELHQLHGEKHLSSRSTPSDCRRGAWFRKWVGKGRTKKQVPVYYPDGYAVLDWESRAQHHHYDTSSKKQKK